MFITSVNSVFIVLDNNVPWQICFLNVRDITGKFFIHKTS